MSIGIDIGGSKIIGVLWNGKKILKSVEFATPKNLKKFENTLKRALKLLNGRGSIKKIGIGFAGAIKNNKIASATNIKYLKNFDFRSLNPARGWTKLKIDNDARCFARAEYHQETARSAKSALFITLGTGVGRAFGKDRKILNIRRFEYAEDWEKDYQKIKNKKVLSEFLGEKLSFLIDALNPEVVILGGGVAEKKGYYEEIAKMLKARFLTLVIRRGKLGKFAGSIGAAMLFPTNWA